MDNQIPEINNIEAAIEAILFAAGFPVKYEFETWFDNSK